MPHKLLFKLKVSWLSLCVCAGVDSAMLAEIWRRDGVGEQH